MISLLPEERRKKINENLNFLKETATKTIKDERKKNQRKLILLDMPFLDLVIQDGPYCPKKCGHCYGSFGPDKPKAPLKLYETVIEQLPETEISFLEITDGEPFHDINRLEKILKILDGMPLDLCTNGDFAKSEKQAKEVLKRIKQAGFSSEYKQNRSLLEDTHDTITISADEYHGMNSFEQTINFLQAYQKIFSSDCTFQDMRNATTTQIPHIYINFRNKQNISLRKDPLFKTRLLKPFKEKLNGKISDRKDPLALYLVAKNLVAGVVKIPLEPEGRALSFMNPKSTKQFKLKNMDHSFDPTPILYLKSTGDLYFAPDYHCLVPGRQMGNIYKKPIKQLIESLSQTPLYKMERIYGVRGIYSQLYKHGLRLKANSHCDACKQIFETKEQVEKMNRFFKKSWEKHEATIRNCA